MLAKDTFVLLVEFLLGPAPKTQSETDTAEKTPPRRWSSNQVKEFGPLHTTLSLLVRNTDISLFESESDSNEEAGLNPYTIPAKRDELVRPSDGMHQALFTIDCSKRFIREVGLMMGVVLSHVAPPPRQCVLTLRESDSTASDAIACSFCFCCWNNQSFSACTIEDIQLQLSIVPSNESKNYFKVLMELLVGLL